MTARQRTTLTTVLALVAAPLCVWAVTAAASVSREAWNGKENITDHAADIRTIRAERSAAIDSVRSQRALDSAFSQRILDAVCADRQNVRACRP